MRRTQYSIFAKNFCRAINENQRDVLNFKIFDKCQSANLKGNHLKVILNGSLVHEKQLHVKEEQNKRLISKTSRQLVVVPKAICLSLFRIQFFLRQHVISKTFGFHYSRHCSISSLDLHQVLNCHLFFL